MATGMGGGMVLPMAITYQEMRSWAECNDTSPTPWEIATLRRMDQAYRAERNRQSEKEHPESAYCDTCRAAGIDDCGQCDYGQIKAVDDQAIVAREAKPQQRATDGISRPQNPG